MFCGIFSLSISLSITIGPRRVDRKVQGKVQLHYSLTTVKVNFHQTIKFLVLKVNSLLLKIKVNLLKAFL